MAKPLAMNMYMQNSAGIFVPAIQQAATADGTAFTSVPEISVGLNNFSSLDRWVSVDNAADSAHVGIGAIGLYNYNGTNWQRSRPNIDNITLISASAVTATQNSPDQTNFNSRGVKIYFNMTNAGTGSVTIHVQGKDPVSPTYFDILVGTAVVTNVFAVYTVYPGITATANVSASDILPRTWRVQAVANNANATTYTVACAVEV